MEIIQDIQKIRFIGIRKLLRQMAKFYKNIQVLKKQ